MTSDAPAPSAHLGTVVAVWVTALVAGVAIGVLAPAQWRAAWLSVALGALIVLALSIQLGVGRSHGFIRRTALSVVGALLVLVVISAGFGLAAIAPA